LVAGTIAKKVPQTIKQADTVGRRMLRRGARIENLEARIREQDRKLKKMRADKSVLEDAQGQDQELLRAFADPRRDELTRGGKVKNFRLPCGVVCQWGLPARGTLVWKGNVRAIVRKLLKLPNWEDYVRIEFRRDKIKADIAELADQGIRNFSEDKQERFRVAV
jgi:phage host-nuclease inhibitor protein Gam